MEPRIEIIREKKLLGKRMRMSLSDNKTVALWRSFMPARNTVLNKVSNELISMQVFDPSYDFSKTDLNATFEKWAAVEVSDFGSIAEGMEPFILPAGMYAVFLHKGPASEGARTFQYIFGTWLPQSNYLLDNRPHFELLGEKYKNDSPDSEEEVWIPVKLK